MNVRPSLALLSGLLLSAPLAASAPVLVRGLDLDTAAFAFDSPAPAADFEATRKAAREKLVTALLEHADWCHKNKCYLERNRTYERVIEYSPDHKKGRKFLGYTWDRKAEEWVRKRAYREPRAGKGDKVLEAQALRATAFTGYRDTMLAAIDKEGVSKRQISATLAELVEMLPEDTDLRQRNGQVLFTDKNGKERWVMEESKRALAWRPKLRERKKELFANYPGSEEGSTEEDEDSWGVTWRGNVENDRVRVLSTGSKGEADKAAQVCHVVWDYTRDLFDHEFDPSYSAYLIASKSDKNSVIDNLAGLEPEQRKRLKKLGGTMMGGTIYTWAPNEDGRVDSSCRFSLSMLMARRFGINSKHGWAHEGIGMYVTERLLGTRLSFFVRATEYAEGGGNLRRQLQDPDSNWMRLAQKVLEKDKKPNIAFMLGRDVNTLTPEDLLVSYALAGYFMEGHEPEVLVEILERIGQGENPAETMEDVLGYDIGTLSTRLLDWLREIRK